MRKIIIYIVLILTCNACNSTGKDSLFKDSTLILSSEKIKFNNLEVSKNIVRTKMQKYIENLESYSIIYSSRGLKIHGYLAKPKNINEPLPLLIYCRGGNRDYGELTDNQSLALARMASNGYIVLASNYSGSTKSEGIDEFGGKDVNDVLQLLEIAKELPFIDSNKIVLLGSSRGGLMVYQVLKNQNHNNNIKAAVLLSCPTDLKVMFKNRPEMERLARTLIPNYTNERENAIYKRSVIQWADSLPKHVPLLLIHGDSDERVNVEHSINLANKLKKQDHLHKLIIYKKAKHSLVSVKDSLIFEREKWLSKYLN
jgi:dipeptidyl aminopeptidase/acylaminoacyl peptidase